MAETLKKGDIIAHNLLKEFPEIKAGITEAEVKELISKALVDYVKNETLTSELAKKENTIDWNNLTAPIIVTGGSEPTNRKPLEITSDGQLLSYGKEVAVKE